MRKYLFPIIAFGSLVMMIVMFKTSATLKTSSTPLGILNLEFAYNSAKADTILNAWQPDGKIDNIEVAKFNTLLDFIFLFFYSLFLYKACKMLSGSYKGVLQKTGLLLANGAILAGVLDILENAGMLFTLQGNIYNSILLLTTFVSIIKWILALAAVTYLLILGVAYLIRMKKNNDTTQWLKWTQPLQ